MAVVPVLPAAQASALTRAYNLANANRRRRLFIALAIGLVLVFVAAWRAEVNLFGLYENVWRFGGYLARTMPTIGFSSFFKDIHDWYWNFGKWLGYLIETLFIAYLGTLLGAVTAFCLCFLAAANITRNSWIRFFVRRLLELLRTIPEIVFALLFVIAFGLGPMPGVIALALHSAGALGKLFAEIVENIDMKPVEGVEAAGGGFVQKIRFAALPQVMAGFASYTLLRFESNVRGASVMGFVGAGGIGQELILSIRSFYYTDVSAILLMIILCVVVIDMVTERVRHRLIGMENGQ